MLLRSSKGSLRVICPKASRETNRQLSELPSDGEGGHDTPDMRAAADPRASQRRRDPKEAQAGVSFWSKCLVAGTLYLGLALVSTFSVWSHAGVVGLLYDWSIPGTRIGIERLLATSWAANNPINLGSFSIFGQGPVWEWLPLALGYLGVSPGVISRMVLIGPIVLSGLGALLFAACVMKRDGDAVSPPIVWPFLIGLVYVCCGDGFFVMSDGAVSLIWFYVAVPWVLALATWAAAPNADTWRLIPVGLTIGVAVSILQFAWWLVPASMLVYVGSGPLVRGAKRRVAQIGVAFAILTGAAVTVNLYWILHFAWVEALLPGLVAATAGGNSGLDYVDNAPTAVQALGVTGSVPSATGSLVANSPAPLVTVLVPFFAVLLLLIVVVVRRPRRFEIWTVGGFLLFAGLSSGEHVFGGIVGAIWGFTVMAPFRGFVHFELISAALLCAVFASTVCAGPRSGRVAARILLVLAVAALALPWIAGNVGSNGRQSGEPRLRTFAVAPADDAKLVSLERRGVGVLDVPTSASVWYWSRNRFGGYIWRAGGVNRTVEYTVARGLANVSAPESGSSSEIGWFEAAPFSGSVSSAKLARVMAAWDLGEVRVSRRAAAFVPEGGFEGPVPATETLAKLKAPYFVPDGVTRDAYYFRVEGVPMGWAQCLQHCDGREIVSPDVATVLNLAAFNSLVRIAVVNAGDTSVSCQGGRAQIVSGVGQELLVRASCPFRRLVLGSVSETVDGYFDLVWMLGIVGWLLGMVWWRQQCRRSQCSTKYGAQGY